MAELTSNDLYDGDNLDIRVATCPELPSTWSWGDFAG
jgi:hypothetical protein